MFMCECVSVYASSFFCYKNTVCKHILRTDPGLMHKIHTH